MKDEPSKEKDQSKSQSSLVDKIQQLGQSNVPQPADSNIHGPADYRPGGGPCPAAFTK